MSRKSTPRVSRDLERVLQRLEPRLAKPVHNVALKASDTQPQVQVGEVKEGNATTHAIPPGPERGRRHYGGMGGASQREGWARQKAKGKR